MEANVTVIIPILTIDDKEKDLLANALGSIKEQKVQPKNIILVIPKNEELKSLLDSYEFDETIKDKVTILENDGETDFCSQINLAAKQVQTGWFSVLEIDDVYANIWFDNFVKYTESYEDVDMFLPIVLDINMDNQFIHFTNEPVWAKDFSEEMGYLDNDALLNFPNFQFSGSIVKTDVFNTVGGMKGGVKMFFNYELFLRMTYYDKKIMTIPKIGYKKLNMRPGSLFWDNKHTEGMIIDPVESRFWYNTARKECYFKTDRGIKYEIEPVE